MEALSEPSNERFVSIASIWELQIKSGLGKLELPGQIDSIGPGWIRTLDARLLPIEISHVGRIYGLSMAHRDPFDRILVAQSIAEQMTLVSPDKVFRHYMTDIIW